FDVVTEQESQVPYVQKLVPPPRGRLNFGWLASSRMFRKMRWAAVAVLGVGVAVACGLRRVQIGLKGHSAHAAAAPEQPLTAGRPGADIAHDVEEVLRLSDVTSDAHYDGNGTVTVRGHLGDPKVLATVIQS